MPVAYDRIEGFNKSLVKIQDDTWKSFIECDTYMDQVKRFNTSSLKILNVIFYYFKINLFYLI